MAADELADAAHRVGRFGEGAGEPVEAIHLAEVALSAAPNHVAALEVMIAAHETLESESENFWLTQWLRKQLADHRATLAAARPKEAES